MQPNEPRLADVRAPWDREGWGVREAIKPKSLWRGVIYNRRYGWFWAPASMDAWRYRRLLEDLDEVCLRTLSTHGALTARELAEGLSRDNLLRTKPDLTGINRISVATAHDWFVVAHRRDLVALCEGRHWKLTERGHEAVRSNLLRTLGPLAPALPFLLGGIAGALEWITLHQVVVVVIVYSVLLALAVAVPHLWMSRSEKRQNPATAVVAIETLRSAGRPIPAL